MPADPLAYFISWTCYGHWLHGDERGSVDLEHNAFAEVWLSPNPALHEQEREVMTQPPYELDAPRRAVVLAAIRSVCAYRDWTLHAVHVRALHVHAVVSGDAAPEKMLNDMAGRVPRRGNHIRARKTGHSHGTLS
jgi:hypothetical protein